MANVTVSSSSISPKTITVEESGKSVSITDTTAINKSIVVDQLTTTTTAANLGDIGDVNITSIQDNQILVYDSATSKWVNETSGASAPVTSVNTQTGAVVLDTDDISEGSTNLYYADSLVDAHLVGGTGVTYSAGNISIGQPVATTDDVEFNEVTAAEFIGNLRGANLMKAQAGEALTKGDVVYISGISGNTPVVSKADADDSTKMPAVGLANATVSTSANVDVLTFGQITNIDTTQNIGGTWAEGDSLYVNTTAGQLTKTQPAGETSLVQKIAKIEKVHASTGILLIQGAGRSNATPNLNNGNIFIGNSSNYAETVDLDTKITALGYIKSETDSQTLSFSSPNLTISNGNTVDISGITSGYLQDVVDDTSPQLGGNLDAQSLYKITNLVDPTSNQDAATKAYVDSSSASGISEVKDDTSPELGGSLDVLNQFIQSSTNIVRINDALQVMQGNSLRFENTAQTQNVTIGAPATNTGYDLTLPTTAPSNDQYLTVNSSGQIAFTDFAVVDDTTPQLGGNLDAQSNQITAVSKLEVTNTSTDDSILLTTTEDTSTAAPVLTFKRNSSSPADGDYLGQLKFKGENDADQEVIYAKITAKTSDVTDTTEDGLIEFALRKAGANNIGMRLTSTDLKLLNGTEMDMGSQQIHNVADPTSAQDVATKNYVDSGASGLTSIVQDTTPQLGGNLDVNNFTISNANTSGIVDFDSRATITENVADYSLLIDNQNTQGLGIKIKAGDDAYAGSLAILSVADKDDTLVLTAKADGAVIVYDNLTVDDVFINSPSAGLMQISTLVGDDLNITTNSGTLSLNSINFPGSDGSANQILKTDGAGQLSFVDVSTLALQNVVEDTTPELGGELDQNGQMIKDSTRNYQILGDQASPSSSDYDSFSNTNRVYGVVNVAEVTGPSNRVHSHPRLTKVTATADSSNSSNGNPGRIRSSYSELSYQLDGFDNTTTGFGRGANNGFYSCMVKNDNASNNASTLTEQRALVVTPQAKASSTGGLTITDMRGINMEPNINSGLVNVTTMYGLYYNSINNGTGTVSNEYSFYGNVDDASAYNAGGFQMPVVTVANLSNLPAREGNTAYVTNNTAGTGSVAKCLVFYDGSNWKLAHDPGTTAA